MLKKITLCMFCGNDKSLGRMTMEHFVPRALWDQERPKLTRTVPAHEQCNNVFAADNEYFRDVLASEAGAGDHPEVIKLLKGSLKRKLEKQTGSLVKTFKGIGLRRVMTKGGIYLGRHPIFDVDGQRINRVLQNVMKGIYCSVRREPMPQDFIVKIFACSEVDLSPFKNVIGAMTKWNDFGDDVFRCRYVFDERKGVAMACIMQFYKYRAFLGLAHPGDMSKYWAEEQERLLINVRR